MIEVSRDWTRYRHPGDRWSRERCLVCRGEIADNREVLVGPKGLVHKECWWHTPIRKLMRVEELRAQPRRRRAEIEAVRVARIVLAVALVAAVVVAQILR